ncbi:MAG: DUF1565 domain-containing protein [Deltaproteobacteria bacterium]|nr:DUF1565 domain-containing protein [Deltaproteobacteria bacterium]
MSSWRQRLVAILLLPTHLGGCGADESTPSPAAECLPPNRVIADGRCVAPGVHDDGCPAGTIGLDDGSCQPAGIPPEMCAAGCESVLPVDPCPRGLMALPGETICRSVMPCSPGQWGDLPVDGTTQHVDGAYLGGASDGTAQHPWTTIGQAVTAAAPGALVAVAEGSYLEDVLITGKPVRLWGVCPERVVLVGTGNEVAALSIFSGANGTEVGGMAITGETIGVIASGSVDVTVDRVWVVDTVRKAINAEATYGPTTMVVRGSLVEASRGIGVYVGGAQASVENTVVRDNVPTSSATELGQGIYVEATPSTGLRGALWLSGSVVERNQECGLYVMGSDAAVANSVVRGTLPRTSDQQSGRGIMVLQHFGTGDPATLDLSHSVVADNHEAGIIVGAANLVATGSVVSGTRPRLSDQFLGVGILADGHPDTGEPATVTLLGSVIAHNHEVGLSIKGSHAVVEATVVGDTASRVPDLKLGHGVSVMPNGLTGDRSTLTMRTSVLTRNSEGGLVVAVADAWVEAYAVVDTQLNGLGLFGDGILAIASAADPTNLYVDGSRVENSPRAAISSFGGFVSIATTKMLCQSFDLDGEPFEGAQYGFEDLGQNRCGCPTADSACLIVSAGLEPPDAIAPIR